MNRNKIKINIKRFLIFAPITYVLWLFSPIEFINYGYASILFFSFTFVYFISVLILVNLIVYDKEINVIKSINGIIRILRIILNITYVSGLLVIIYIGFLGLLLGGGFDEKTIFIHKINPEIKIIKRGSNGGAWDSDPQGFRIIKVTPIFYFFQNINHIDTNKIDRNEWQRINDQ